jgi:O-antigen/teichoic acid export membrane protein
MSLFSSASLTLVVRIALFVLSLVTNIILARSLGPAGRGIYAIAVLVPTILTLIANIGIGPASVYYVSRGSVDKRQVVAVSLLFAVAVGVAAYAALVLAVALLGGRSVIGVEPRYLLVGGVSLPFLLASTFMQGVLNGERRFVELNVVILSQYALLAAILAVLLFTSADRLTTSIAAWTASSVLSGLLAVAFVARTSPISLTIDVTALKAMLRYGSLAYLGTLTAFVNYRFDILLVNIFAGPTQVGLYAVGAGLAEVIWFFPNSLVIALAPRVAAAAETEASVLSAQATRSVLVVAAVSALLIAVLAPVVIPFFFGAAFAESSVAVWLLLPGVVTFSAWKLMSCYLLGRNLLRQDLLAATAAMVVTVVLDLALIPSYGFRGAAVASSVAYSIAMLVALYWSTRRSGLGIRAWLIPVLSDSYPVISRLHALRIRGSHMRD